MTLSLDGWRAPTCKAWEERRGQVDVSTPQRVTARPTDASTRRCSARSTLRFYDFESKGMVDHPSPTTLSLAAIKAIIDPLRDDEAQLSQPPGMKQFAGQVIVDFYTDWEEHYRVELARAHQCDKYDFQINYFGDLGKLRHDYVHNRGMCSNSAHCDTLKWFSAGDLMIPTPANYVQLLTEFPADELRRKPSRVETGRAPVKGSADIPMLREFEKVAREVHGSVGPALNEALAEWTRQTSQQGQGAAATEPK
jgi:hypothetical protein